MYINKRKSLETHGVNKMTNQFDAICEIQVKCDHCGKTLKPFEGMLNDLCIECTKKGVENKVREVAGK